MAEWFHRSGGAEEGGPRRPCCPREYWALLDRIYWAFRASWILLETISQICDPAHEAWSALGVPARWQQSRVAVSQHNGGASDMVVQVPYGGGGGSGVELGVESC
jgi:hypothetical protein